MATYAVRYTYDERADVRDVFRPEHRAYLADLAEQGRMLGSGPFADGDPGALLVFAYPDRPSLDAALAADPFAREGLVAAVEIREWALAVGPWAS